MALPGFVALPNRRYESGSGIGCLAPHYTAPRQNNSGNLPIDNNAIENEIRPIAIGKKNWLFAGSERAGKRAAAIQTLLGTARINGLNLSVWLKDTLDNLPTWPKSRIDELLPLRASTSSAT